MPVASSSAFANGGLGNSRGHGSDDPPTRRGAATTAATTQTQRPASSSAVAGRSTASRPTVSKVSVASSTSQGASTQTTQRAAPVRRPAAPAAANANRNQGTVRPAAQSQQPQRLRPHPSTSSLATSGDVEMAGPSLSVRTDTASRGSVTRKAAAPTPASERPSATAPVRGNQIFHQLKADVLRGDASFPEIAQAPLDLDALHDRLIALALAFLEPQTLDVLSASLYSFLALTIFPNSVAATRARAHCLLEAGQGAVFPFVTERSRRGGAAAALATLEEGPAEVFADEECAKIWSKACLVLGRAREAEAALSWCLEGGPQSVARAGPSDGARASVPVLVSQQDRQQGIMLAELGRIAQRDRDVVAAERNFAQARSKDPWNWAAWIGLCELGCAPLPSSAFPESVVRHDPLSFLDAATIALGGTPATIDSMGESAKQVSATAPAQQRPGSRLTAARDSKPATATAKRTKSATEAGQTQGATAGRTAAAFGIAAGAAPGPRSRTRNATSSTAAATSVGMSRTLSQAKTNERPPSSLSNTSNAAEKDKVAPPAEPLTVTKDSLRRSTRAQAPTTQATPTNAGARSTLTGAVRSRTMAAKGVRVQAPRAAGTAAAGTAPLSSAQDRNRMRPDRGDQASSEPESAPAGAVTGPATTPAAGAARGSRTALRGLTQNRPNAEAKAMEPPVDDVARSIRQATLRKAAEEAAKWRRVDHETLSYLRLLGGAFKDALEYRGDKLLRTFSSPSDSCLSTEAMNAVLDTPDVGVLIARVHHDMAQYPEAEQCFKAALRSRKSIVESMDIYSLVLYHLNRHEELSGLAQELLDIDADAVETHLTVGNLFSLNSSPAIALRSFRRACLAAPSYAYSYTLAGHECLALGQSLKALRFFRQAVKKDRRHWNGWSGIGTMLSTEGRWSEAKFALVQACALNASNSGLHEVLAVVHEMVGDKAAALESYSRAILLNPRSASATLRKAELLWSMNRLEPAHAALLQALSLNQHDAKAHLLLAESYMRKGGGSFAPLNTAATRRGRTQQDAGSKAKAVGDSVAPKQYQEEIARHLAIAVDLDPALARRIKAMTEGMGATLRGQVRDRASAAVGVGVAGAGMTSIGSSFSGIDESRRPYDESGWSYSEGVVEDSMGVLQDEDVDVVGSDGDGDGGEDDDDDGDEGEEQYGGDGSDLSESGYVEQQGEQGGVDDLDDGQDHDVDVDVHSIDEDEDEDASREGHSGETALERPPTASRGEDEEEMSLEA
ncbi:unnamed protein product [Parajaminaea phylloscopi]